MGITAGRYVRFFAAFLPVVALLAQQGFVLHDATPVRLRLSRNLSSADAKAGDTADFEVLEDVKVGDTLVIARGGTAIATITEAEAKRRMARGGKLDVNIDYVRLVDGDKVALRAVKEVKGGGHTGAMTGAIVATSLVFWPAAPFFLFMHGKDITIPKGTEITAYVEGEITLDPAKFGISPGSNQAPTAPSPGAARDLHANEAGAPAHLAEAPSVRSSPKPMTNRDVVELKAAGLSDEFVIAKIQKSTPDYQLDTEEIIALKKANVSEAVIEAMMTAASPALAPPPVTPLAAPSTAPAAPAPQAVPKPQPAADSPKEGLLTKLKKVFSDDGDGRRPAAPPPPTPPAEPPVPPEYDLTSVTILSKPAGARILVDGYPAGVTPSVVKLMPGTYKLTLQADGFPAYTQQITVEPGQVSSFGVALDTAK